nr:hypothetical protein [Streptomyces sp. A 4/2]
MSALPVGEVVRDGATGRVGEVRGHGGPYVQLRPVNGGKEWDAKPEQVEPVGMSELLSARVAEANARSRNGGRA